MPRCHVFAYSGVHMCMYMSVVKKLDFSQLRVWKRAVRFLPHKITSFRRKESLSETPKFHKAGPLQTGSNAF